MCLMWAIGCLICEYDQHWFDSGLHALQFCHFAWAFHEHAALLTAQNWIYIVHVWAGAGTSEAFSALPDYAYILVTLRLCADTGT